MRIERDNQVKIGLSINEWGVRLEFASANSIFISLICNEADLIVQKLFDF